MKHLKKAIDKKLDKSYMNLVNFLTIGYVGLGICIITTLITKG